MSRRLVLEDGRAERELVLRDVLIVGRDPACDVSDSDPRLSRRHAEFRVTPEGIVVKDLDSRNGIRVNGRPVTETLLAPGDLVEIAHLVVRFTDDAAGDPAAQARPSVTPVPVERVQVREDAEDDRTMVVPRRPLSTVVSGPISDTIRREAIAYAEAARDLPLEPGAAVAAQPPGIADGPLRRLGVRDLMGSSWGWRVLLQGILLAGLVFLITAIPMLSWFTATTGPIAPGMLVRMLAAPFGASLFAGLMVAALIARTTAHALGADDRS